MTKCPTVHSEKLALKLASIRNHELPTIAEQIEQRPKLAELLWFIQWKSMQPGGLARFAEELVSDFAERLGTKSLVKAKGAKLSYQEKRAIWSELPEEISGDIYHWAHPDILCLGREPSPSRIDNERRLQLALKEWDAARIVESCRAEALSSLPDYLANLCQNSNATFNGADCPYFDDVIEVLIESMVLHEKHTLKRLARTAVTEKVFDALDYAQSERCMVRIEGDSRFGKTESVKTWCESRPGQARLVNVPSSNTLADLLRKVADALGIPYTYKTGQTELKIKVEFTIRNGGLFLVLDEGAFLVPQTYNRNSAPVRLNWVRTEIVDRGLPLAIVVTPQAFHSAVRNFVHCTDYAMEQFLGRTLLPVTLPSELEEKDLIAVARIHFPEMGDNYLGYIAAQAMLSENYLKAVEAISKRARFTASRAGHKVTLGDIDRAISEVIPSAPARPATVRKAAGGSSRPEVKAPSEAPVQRGLKPVLRTVKPEDFPSRSLRGVGPEKVESELVSVET